MERRFYVNNSRIIVRLNNGCFTLLKSITKLNEIFLYNLDESHFSIYRGTNFIGLQAYVPVGLFSNDSVSYVPIKLELQKKNKIRRDINFKFNLRENQKIAVKMIKQRVSMLKKKNVPVYINLSLECAFGKTVVGTYLITRYRLKTLVIVPRKSLIGQWVEHLEDSGLNVETSYSGVLKLMKQRQLDEIDVLIVPDKHLTNESFIEAVSQLFSMVIIDESHYYNMQNDISISRFLTFYSFRMCFGLTGSPRYENRLYLGQDIAFKDSRRKKVGNDLVEVCEKDNGIEINAKGKREFIDAYVTKDEFINITFICISENMIVTLTNIDMESYEDLLEITKTDNFVTSVSLNLKDCFHKVSDNNIIMYDVYIEEMPVKKIINVVTDRCFDISFMFGDEISRDVTQDIYTNYKRVLKIENDLKKKYTKQKAFVRKTLINKLIVQDFRRHNTIIHHIKRIYNYNTRCLILTEFRNNMTILYEDIKKFIKTNVFMGDVKNNITKVYGELKKLDNEPYIVVSTISASFQGISIDNLNTLIIVTPISCEKTIVQSCGRILRVNNIMTREIYIYNDCSISEEVKCYLNEKNIKFVDICKKNGWEELKFLL